MTWDKASHDCESLTWNTSQRSGLSKWSASGFNGASPGPLEQGTALGEGADSRASGSPNSLLLEPSCPCGVFPLGSCPSWFPGFPSQPVGTEPLSLFPTPLHTLLLLQRENATKPGMKRTLVISSELGEICTSSVVLPWAPLAVLPSIFSMGLKQTRPTPSTPGLALSSNPPHPLSWLSGHLPPL